MHLLHTLPAIFMAMFFGFFVCSPIQAQENPEVAPLECPQCGAWQISSSNINSYVSDVVLVDSQRVFIQGCGSFFYDMPKIESKLVSEHGYEYSIKTSFNSRSSPSITSICGGENEELWTPSEWSLAINVYGHFREGGYAYFSLTRKGVREPVLTFRAWNMDREDPCGAGSGFGSGECLLIANGELRKALWVAVDSAEYQLSRVFLAQKPRPFNLTKFLDKAEKYCAVREKNRGGGHWPTTWVLECVSEQIEMKLKQFRRWEACAKSAVKDRACPFPEDSISKLLSPHN